MGELVAELKVDPFYFVVPLLIALQNIDVEFQFLFILVKLSPVVDPVAILSAIDCAHEIVELGVELP